MANLVANSPTSSVCVVCSITLLATEIADFTRLRHPTDPTSCVSLRKEMRERETDRNKKMREIERDKVEQGDISHLLTHPLSWHPV